MRESYYFETSAVNFLYDVFSKDEKFSSIKTKKLQVSKGRKWYLSSATLWEIFKTKDEKKRYELFDFCRCLFYDHLIKCPEEIIINFIKSGCPSVEKSYNLDSSDLGLFAKEWRNACKDIRFVFQPDEKQINDRTNALQFFGKYLYKKQKGYELKGYPELIDQSYHLLGIRLESLLKKLFNEFDNITEEEKQFTSVVFHVALITICYGITLDQQIIESYWNSIGISKPISRIECLVENSISLFFRGPIANIAKMMVLQSNGKYGRGVFFDSLHSAYITYSDLYFTADNHFINFKNEIADPNMLKIVHTKDMVFETPVISARES